MAFETIDERAAGICVGLPFGRVYMEPSAVAFDAADQQHLAMLFREPLAGAAVNVVGTVLRAPERRALQAPRRRR
jgi:hypothetical protein